MEVVFRLYMSLPVTKYAAKSGVNHHEIYTEAAFFPVAILRLKRAEI